jgi:Nucleoside-diphosphate-sugar epimerases
MIDNNHVGNGVGFLEFIGNQNIKIKIGDIRDYSFIEKATENVDKVIHLAAIVGEPACDKDEKLAEQVNINGTLNVLKACKKNLIKHLHFMSTASSYGVQDDEIIANEQTAVNPISFYAKTKLDMEEAILNDTNSNFYCTIFRPSTVHGMSTRMRFDLIVNTMSKHCYLDKKLSLFGLTLWRPIFWVGDAGRAINLIVNSEEEIVKNQIYNCGNNF